MNFKNIKVREDSSICSAITEDLPFACSLLADGCHIHHSKTERTTLYIYKQQLYSLLFHDNELVVVTKDIFLRINIPRDNETDCVIIFLNSEHDFGLDLQAGITVIWSSVIDKKQKNIIEQIIKLFENCIIPCRTKQIKDFIEAVDNVYPKTIDTDLLDHIDIITQSELKKIFSPN